VAFVTPQPRQFAAVCAEPAVPPKALLTEINADDRGLCQKSLMEGSIRRRFEELSQLRERAAQLCEETQELIAEYRRLKSWCEEMRPTTLPISDGFCGSPGVLGNQAATRASGSSSRPRDTLPAVSTFAPTHDRATNALASVASTS